MVMLRSRGDRVPLGIDRNPLLPHGDQLNQRKSLFGSSDDSELLVWLKRVALDPCNSKLSNKSVRKLINQTLRLRKVLSLTSIECPQRKRKFQLFLRSDKSIVAFGLATKGLNDQHVKRLDIGHSYTPNSIDSHSSVDSTECHSAQSILNSYSLDSTLTFGENFQAMPLCNNFNHVYEATNFSLSNKDISSLVNTDDSIDDCLTDSGCLVIEEAPSMESNELVANLTSLSSKEIPRKESAFLKCNYQSRPVIPIGPGFQAEIPVWRGSINEKDFYNNNPENLKFMGKKIWPSDIGGTEIDIFKEFRKRSCSYISKGSTKCTKHHILKGTAHL